MTLFSFSTCNAYADVFLKIDSIPGDVTAQGFQNDIQLDSFHFGSTRTISSPTGTGDRTAGAPSVSDLDVTKLMEKSSVPLVNKLLTGNTIPKMEIFLTKNQNGKLFTFAHYTLENVLISAYSVSSGGDRPSESISFNYGKLQTEFFPQNADGSTGQPIAFCWDNIGNKICTVSKLDTTTTLTSGPNPSTFGQSVTFTATISPSVPDGETVTFLDGTAILGTGTTKGSVATFSTSSLLVGLDFKTATYSGDSNFNPSTSPQLQQTVNKADTATIVISSLNPSLFTQSVTFTGSVSPVSPGAGAPSGTIVFFDGVTQLGSPVTLTGGSATFTTSSLLGGTHSITAKYEGDPDFNTSTSSEYFLQVKPNPTVTLSPPSGTGQIIFNSKSGGFISLNSILPPNLTTSPPAGGSYPLGFFSWSISGFLPPTSGTVTITSPATLDSNAKYFKLIGGNWVSISPITISGNKMTITIIDNGPLDSNPTSGVISDPGTIATPTNGRVTGEGNIGKGTDFSFEVTSDIGTKHSTKGNLEYHDKSAKITLDGNKVSFLSVDPTITQATFVGNGTLDNHNNDNNKNDDKSKNDVNHHGYTFIASIIDPDKTGDHDVFSITITDSSGKVLYHNSGNVKGHIEIHKFVDKDDKSDSGSHHNDNNNDKNNNNKK